VRREKERGRERERELRDNLQGRKRACSQSALFGTRWGNVAVRMVKCAVTLLERPVPAAGRGGVVVQRRRVL